MVIFLMPITLFIRPVKGVMDDLGLPWISCMAEPLDDDGNRSHPVAGFDNYKFGTDMAEYVVEYAQETWAGC